MDIYTVSQVNSYISGVIDDLPLLRGIYVCGEISNFKHYRQSGHMYFTLKDERTQISVIMFAGDNQNLEFEPEDGMKVLCFGRVRVHERDGIYRLYCRDMQPQGVGALTIAFEQLKKKLEDEGLFREENKKPIPKYPERVGVATSNMGAAVEDIKNVISRRYPVCDIVIVPTIVQGDTAAPDIVRSIQMLDAMDDIDVIIVGRGGGSIEDLWAFNTEQVARAVYNCKTPVISAVGHETDYTICDFVADLRAPTPSAAAELAVPELSTEILFFNSLSAELDVAINNKIEGLQDKLNIIAEKSILADIDKFFDAQYNKINSYSEKLISSYKYILSEKEGAFRASASSLNALSPLSVIARGYSIVRSGDRLIKAVDDVKCGDDINIRLSDGSINAVVKGESNE